MISLLDLLGVPPGAYACAVMVGNHLERDIKGANALGMISVWLDWAPRRSKIPADDSELPGFAAANVCSGEPHTVGDLAATLAAAMGGPAPEIVGGARAGDVRHVVADPALARKALGFVAEIGFADGVARFATDPLR